MIIIDPVELPALTDGKIRYLYYSAGTTMRLRRRLSLKGNENVLDLPADLLFEVLLDGLVEETKEGWIKSREEITAEALADLIPLPLLPAVMRAFNVATVGLKRVEEAEAKNAASPGQ